MTVGVRVASPTGWQGADDALYYSAAESVLAGAPLDRLHHHGSRMAMVLPIAASISVFGVNPEAVFLPTTVASVVCVLLVAILGRLIWGPFEGIIAATIVSFLPCFRLYSTSAYPDIHGCMWATLAVVLAVASLGVRRSGPIWALGIACGLSVGLAVSAKVFLLTVIIPIGAIVWSSHSRLWQRRALGIVSIAMGLGLMLLIDGLFYRCVAGDFFFKYHMLSVARSGDNLFASAGVSPTEFLREAWHRFAMLFNPDRSTWGVPAIAFWPATVIVLFRRSPGRLIALWAISAYLLIALVPVRFQHGPQLFPFFGGRTVLATCIPFALCTAWVIQYLSHRHVPVSLQPGLRPVLLGVVVLASFALPSAVEGIRHSHTKTLGLAIKQAIATTDWGNAEEVFIHPSLYLRYRVLFPDSLRARLRVTADAASPDRWYQSTKDIQSRKRPLPPPGSAYLVATPAQLRGEPERWDYGVTLPRDGLERWADLTPVTVIGLYHDGRIDSVSANEPGSGRALIHVIADKRGSHSLGTVARKRHMGSICFR